MMKKTLAVLAMALFAKAGAAQATIIGFDDAGTASFQYLPTAYQGLNWTDWA